MGGGRVATQYDDLLLCEDGGLKTSSGAAEVDGSAVILDLGEGLIDADLIIDLLATEVDNSNEICTIGVQISSSSTFASDIYQVAALSLGDAVPLAGDTDMGIGRYVLPFRNQIANGVTKRYMRVYHTIAGTVGTGFNYTAYVGMKRK
jgi:hypothetical protein